MQSPKSSMTREGIERYIRERLAESLNTIPEKIDIKASFTEMGLSSITAVSMSGELADKLNREISPTIFWDYSTIESLSEYIYSNAESGNKHHSKKSAKMVHFSDRKLPESKYHKKSMAHNDKYADSKKDTINVQQSHNLISEISLLNSLKKQVNATAGMPLYFVISENMMTDMQKSGKSFVNYSIYDYLGFAKDPEIKRSIIEGINLFGSSVSASRLAGGEKPFHQELEDEISDFLHMEDTIVFTSGHATNVTTIGHIMRSTDLIICDEYSHNSILQGAKLSGATTLKFSHNDLKHLDQILKQHASHYDRVMIIIEGVYSMDGDIPDLPTIIYLKKKYQTLLYIDEAHSVGVIGETGRGIMEYFHVNPEDVDFSMGTLGKALGSIGGYVSGKKEIIDYLKHTVPGFVYSLGFGPAQAYGALASLRKLRANPELIDELKIKSTRFATLLRQAGLNCGASHDTPIIPVIIGNSHKTIEICADLRKEGVFTQAIIYPAVDDQTSRLRIFMNVTHSHEVNEKTAMTIINSVNKYK